MFDVIDENGKVDEICLDLGPKDEKTPEISEDIGLAMAYLEKIEATKYKMKIENANTDHITYNKIVVNDMDNLFQQNIPDDHLRGEGLKLAWSYIGIVWYGSENIFIKNGFLAAAF